MTQFTMAELLEGVEYTLTQAGDLERQSYYSSAQSFAAKAIDELTFIAALKPPMWKITEDEFKEGKRLWDRAQSICIAMRGKLGG